MDYSSSVKVGTTSPYPEWTLQLSESKTSKNLVCLEGFFSVAIRFCQSPIQPKLGPVHKN